MDKELKQRIGGWEIVSYVMLLLFAATCFFALAR